MRRRTYSMMSSASTMRTKDCQKRGQNLKEIPLHLADIFPVLEKLDVGDNLLDDTAIPKLMQLIENLPTLKYLDITDNFISANAIIQLHDFVEEKNTLREPAYQIKLVSEFGNWNGDKKDYAIARNLWQLTPEQWTKTENPFPLINALSIEIRDKPFNLRYYESAFERIFNTPCATDWPLLACICVATNVSLLIACIKKLTPKVFYNISVDLFTRTDIPEFNANLLAPILVSYCFLGEAHSPGLATQFVQAVFPQETCEKNLSLGLIHYYEADYEEALKQFLAGANKGCPSCHYNLAFMMHNGNCPQTFPYNAAKLESLWITACRHQNILAEYELALFYESAHNMIQAFTCYEKARTKLNDNPALKEQIPSQILYGIQRRIRFRTGLVMCIDQFFRARINLSHRPGASQTRAWSQAMSHHTLNQFWLRIGKPAVNQLLQDLGESLLKSFEQNENLFKQLSERLINLLSQGEPNSPLLSLDPNLFKRALTDQVRIFQIERLGAQEVQRRFRPIT